VLITGETGVGKDVAARGIHKLAGDSDSLITLNCAAIPESLIESELFGHEKGSFTGAITRRKGVFELAEGGTLVLDEISEMPLQLQSKLLSVLEERRLRRLVGSSEIKIDVRVIATSNRDLDEEIAAGRFRRDLYYRLAVITIHLPPLRERLSDIPQIANSLLQELTGGTITSLPAEQLNSLINYSWPGNTRELRNILERAVILAAGGLPDPASLLRTTTPENALSSAGAAGAIRPLAEVERELIARAMARYQGNRQLAAQALGLSPSTLRRRLIDYDLA
jgi:DNA-binding NtrC family response regulator